MKLKMAPKAHKQKQTQHQTQRKFVLFIFLKISPLEHISQILIHCLVIKFKGGDETRIIEKVMTSKNLNDVTTF